MEGNAYLMNTAGALFVVCYIPELYANYKNKNANGWNVPEKVVTLAGSSFALAYSVLNRDQALMPNYGPLFALDLLALGMRLYYVCKNYRRNAESKESSPTTERECPQKTSTPPSV